MIDMIKEDNGWILLVLFAVIIIFITVSITDNKYEPKQDYTVGRCVEWNHTFTEIDIYSCEAFEDEDIRCEVFLGDNQSAKIEVRNHTCLNELYSKGFDSYNYTEYESCFFLKEETYSCTARMVIVEDW